MTQITKNYDGSYCPKCQSQQVEIIDNEHDFGFLELNVKCSECDLEYKVFLFGGQRHHLNDNATCRIETVYEEAEN